MPSRRDIRKILIIGGLRAIGQVCEFDCSASQACRALKGLGYEVLLVDSNPYTVMTDPAMVDVSYIEPVTLESVSRIIEKERPDAVMPNLGGQAGLNLASELARKGVLERYGVEIIGLQEKSIERIRGRMALMDLMKKLDVDMPRAMSSFTLKEAKAIASKLVYPVTVRSAYSYGEAPGALVYNAEELQEIGRRSISASLFGQFVVEESLLDFDRVEIEVMRDSNNQMVVISMVENMSTVGVYAGDSCCLPPMIPVEVELKRKIERYAYRIVEAIGVAGCTNIEFALDRKSGRVVVTEVRPWACHSSALVSKAGGIPISSVSASLAVGCTLDEIPFPEGTIFREYVPRQNSVAVKLSTWSVENVKESGETVGTQVRVLGHVMSIGKTYKEALQKAIRSLDPGCLGLGFVRDFHQRSLDELMEMLESDSNDMHFIMYEALRKGATIENLSRKTSIKSWFIHQIKELVDLEEEILCHRGKEMPDSLLVRAKLDGFADKYLSEILGLPEKQIRERRTAIGILPAYEKVRASSAAAPSHYYSTYHPASGMPADDHKKKIMIVGGGPNRVGHGMESNYCCNQAAFAIRDELFESIIVDCNPESVSANNDTCSKLFIEPITVENVLGICEREIPEGVIVQFGGRMALDLARDLSDAGVKVLGTTAANVDLTEDRDNFQKLARALWIALPESSMAKTAEEAVQIAERIGYPVMVRSSCDSDCQAIEVIHDRKGLFQYFTAEIESVHHGPVFIEKLLEDSHRVSAAVISDGTDAFIAAVMESIEIPTSHARDSASVTPPVSITPEQIATVSSYARKLAVEMKVVGLVRLRFAIEGGSIYALESDLGTLRTWPLISKIYNIPVARIATQVMLGKKLSQIQPKVRRPCSFAVKGALFPFAVSLPFSAPCSSDAIQAREVCGVAGSFGMALLKAQQAAQYPLPSSGTVLISVCDKDKEAVLDVAKKFRNLGFEIKATSGTQRFLSKHGVQCGSVNKMREARPNIVDEITNGKIQLVINTVSGKLSWLDHALITKGAIKYKIPCITTIAAAIAASAGVEASPGQDSGELKSLQEFFGFDLL